MARAGRGRRFAAVSSAGCRPSRWARCCSSRRASRCARPARPRRSAGDHPRLHPRRRRVLRAPDPGPRALSLPCVLPRPAIDPRGGPLGPGTSGIGVLNAINLHAGPRGGGRRGAAAAAVANRWRQRSRWSARRSQRPRRRALRRRRTAVSRRPRARRLDLPAVHRPRPEQCRHHVALGQGLIPEGRAPARAGPATAGRPS